MLSLLSGRLKEARLRARMSQARLALEMGARYDHTVISSIETGRCKLRLDGLIAAAQALQVSSDYLLGLTDDPGPRPLSVVSESRGRPQVIHVRSAEEGGIMAALHEHYNNLNPYGRRIFLNTLERTFPDTTWRRRDDNEVIFDFERERRRTTRHARARSDAAQ